MYDNDFARVLDLKIFLLYKNTIRIGHMFHYLDRFLPIQRYYTIDVQTTQISTDHHHCKRGYLLLSLYFHGFDQRINERYFLSLKYFIFQRQESITVKSTRHDPLPSSHIVCPRHLAQIHVIDMWFNFSKQGKAICWDSQTCPSLYGQYFCLWQKHTVPSIQTPRKHQSPVFYPEVCSPLHPRQPFLASGIP